MLLSDQKISISKAEVGFFRFKSLTDKYLITNDTGEYCFLEAEEFKDFISGKIEIINPEKYMELQSKGFIHSKLNFDELIKKYSLKNYFLRQGPSLHIIVVTLRCDHNCIYCQVSSQSCAHVEADMDINIAGKVVDRIFESPNENITIEFQGGEPLLNFEIIKFIIEYAFKKNKEKKKNLIFSLVSNLTFMNKERLYYFLSNNVSICTSLDGHEPIHKKNRGTAKNYQNTVRWIKKIRNASEKKACFNINALTTITRHSLAYPKEIIDEFIGLKLGGIHLRPVSPFGVYSNKKLWNSIKVEPEQFLDFYKKALDYIVYLNLKGIKFFERSAKIFLSKIFNEKDPNFLDLRSPCGAGIGQIAYNFNGNVYTCDEARMLASKGDESFGIGHVEKDSFLNFINNDVVKTVCLASCLDNLAECSQCVYKPYCGVCPIYNYVTEGNIFSKMPNNERCIINSGILDYLFEMIRGDKKNYQIFKEWASLDYF